MPTPTKKAAKFASERECNEKPVTELPGIGTALGVKLSGQGFDKVYLVFDKFEELGEEQFKSWLKETCGANSKQQNDCVTGLKEWRVLSRRSTLRHGLWRPSAPGFNPD